MAHFQASLVALHEERLPDKLGREVEGADPVNLAEVSPREAAGGFESVRRGDVLGGLVEREKQRVGSPAKGPPDAKLLGLVVGDGSLGLEAIDDVRDLSDGEAIRI